VLDRLRPRRAFRRLAGQLLERLLQADDPTSDVPHTDDPRPGLHDTLTGEGDAQEPSPEGH
jgi:proteasome alpha subunit